MITVAHSCSALLIAIDNISTVCEIGLYRHTDLIIYIDCTKAKKKSSAAENRCGIQQQLWILCLFVNPFDELFRISDLRFHTK